MTRKEKERLFLLKKEKLKRTRQSNFWAFCLHLDYDFFKEREVVLKEIANDMQRLIMPIPPETELDILNVSLPPRTGKSYLCTAFTAWTFGNFPGASVMRNTVTSKLYNKLSTDVKDIISGETHRGRYKEVFPDIQLETTANEGWKLKSHTQGISYFGAGVEGTIIGFGATLLSIIDDSIGDEFTATNAYQLQKIFSWYTSAADSREEKGCKKLFIGTRWSQKDIVGKLKELGDFEGPRAKDISVPALIDGKSFCEAVHTTESLLKKKKMLSTFIWEAEWMQNPISSAGLLFPANELKWFKGKLQKPESVICKVDVANKGSDYLSAPVGYNYGEDTYIENVVFTQEGVKVTVPAVAMMCFKHNIDKMDIESNNGGDMFAEMVRNKILELKEEGYTCQTHITDSYQGKNKETRILMAEGYIKEHFYFREDYEEGSEYDNFIRNLITYTKSGKNDHDDAPDSLEGLKEMINDYDPDRFALS